MKFWNLSQTFTGKKIKSCAGKFDRFDNEFCTKFLTLSNNTTLSATQSGNLLLWKRTMVSSKLGIKGQSGQDRKCHEAEITDMCFGRDETELLTCCIDGTIAIWDIESILTDSFAEISKSISKGNSFEDRTVAEIELVKR